MKRTAYAFARMSLHLVALTIGLFATQSIAEPLCVDYSTYATDGPTPHDLMINGFSTRDIDETWKSQIRHGYGISLTEYGVLVIFPFPAKEIDIRAAAHCGSELEIRTFSYGQIGSVLSLSERNTGQNLLQDYKMTVPNNGAITRLMTYGGCNEAQVASICATPR
ncbi:hypothetical protein NKG95_02765 [Mesorhizobium sp. M1423]|uniref:hypothetical protein n=1 Tax=Mesorhizobium sp. M1423 TaxID=2957101 RepID=UPI00333A66A5